MNLFRSINELRRKFYEGRRLDQVKRFSCSDKGTPMRENGNILTDARGRQYVRMESGQIRRIVT